jgi:methionyl-tRNA synthetase
MYYITTPIPYANGSPHLGHLLEALFVDTIARFQARTTNERVFVQMGADQHGLKVYETAVANGQTAPEYVAGVTTEFRDLWAQFGVHYDGFVETSSPAHKIVSQLVWKRLAAAGLIYKKSYVGAYCKGCEDFYAPSQLVDGNCPIHGTKPEEMSEENYFFKLSQFKPQILDYLAKADIKPEYIAREQANFAKELQDVSISREKSRLPWGVAVPGDSEQVMYVWFEALINYLTAVVDEETMEQAVEFPYLEEDAEAAIFEEIREAMPIDLMYISKEVAKFHVVVWIGLLVGLGLELPKRVLAHGLINDNLGRKFSKSLSNGVLPEELVARVGVEGTRFIMLHDINIDGDTNFDWRTVLESYNAHLANNLGNLLMRVTTLVEKNFPEGVDIYEVYEKPYSFAPVYTALADLNPKLALDEVLKGASFGNEMLENSKPWTMIKNGETEQAKKVLTELCVLLWDLSEALSIFLPEAAEKIHQAVTSEVIVKAEVLFEKVDVDLVLGDIKIDKV